MKNSIIVLSIAGLFAFSACSEGKKQESKSEEVTQEAVLTAEVSPEQLKSLLTVYFNLKEALVKTDAAAAQETAASLIADMPEDMEAEKVKTAITAISETTDVEAQRAHFKVLSEEVYSLAKSREYKESTIYKQFCPMAFGNTGAYWLSQEKEVLNPYFGDKMLRCGKVQEEI